MSVKTLLASLEALARKYNSDTWDEALKILARRPSGDLVRQTAKATLEKYPRTSLQITISLNRSRLIERARTLNISVNKKDSSKSIEKKIKAAVASYSAREANRTIKVKSNSAAERRWPKRDYPNAAGETNRPINDKSKLPPENRWRKGDYSEWARLILDKKPAKH
jgi:hypothetical protein